MSQQSTSRASPAESDQSPEQHSGHGNDALCWPAWLPYTLLLGLTFSLYAESIYYHFVWDDLAYVLENERIRQLSFSNLRRIWTESYFSQYAPIHLNFLALVYSLADASAFYFHLSQVLLHSACACLLYFVLAIMLPRRVAMMASLLFAVYPPNVEIVAWVSQTKTTLSFLFFLLSFWAFLGHFHQQKLSQGAICVLCLVLSLMAKVSTVVAPAVFLAYVSSQSSEWKGRNRILLLGILFPISLVFAGIHLATTRTLVTPSAALLFDSTLVDSSLPPLDLSASYLGGFYTHLLNAPRVLLFYLRMVLFPFPLSAWQMFRVYGELNWQTGAAWIGVILLCWVLYRSPQRLQFWQLWFYLFLLPVVQVIPNPIWVADRYLYMPAVGGFVLLSQSYHYLVEYVPKFWIRWSARASITTALLLFAWLTQTYLPLWRNDLTLWRATAKNCPTSAYCHHAFGNSLFINGYTRLAIPELYHAVQIRADPAYLADLGDTIALGEGDYERALLAYQAAARLRARVSLSTRVKLARAYFKTGRIDEANRTIQETQQIYPESVDLLVVKAFVLSEQGHRDEARVTLQRAMQLTHPPTSATQLLKSRWPDPAEAGRLLAVLSR